ncbi:MAG: rhodanese-like domain-containing protein [Candidatus Marinimicrobia bacterium]|nr:rhodanese-like domain-containing protein [Candidatus Neomarinimicrobiota bacterium]MCF7827962.1 rhodanese-like domain-containing protein [Candidatus Neomarinimicrobiota bacterium]MCF7879283.1 rhodanese-like domain-containing protein [Candidatus Neomarinimicrobiota bacterium]
MNTRVKQITPEELKEMQKSGGVKLIDVREKREWDYCNIDGAELIPVQNIQSADIDADEDETIVVYCHTGQRSFFATQILMKRGYENVFNLQGGIDAYSNRVDPEIPRY